MRATRGLAEAALISAAVILLQWMGRGPLAAPPLTSWSGALRWADQRDPVTSAMVFVRLLTLALGYHVLVTTALVVLGRVLHQPRLADWAEAWTLPPFRGTAQRLVGLSMSISTLVAGPGASAGAAASRPAVEQVVIERIDLVSSADPSSGGGTATLQVTPPPSTVTPTPAPAHEPPALPASTIHVVVPGDHLWAISEAALARYLGRAPTDAEIDPYWRRMIAANPQFRDPDLIHPGEIVNVPPPSQA